MSNSGIVSRIAGDVVGADSFLANMGTDAFLSCLSRQALEATCAETSVLPRNKVRETRAALVEHFTRERFVHGSARFAPDANEFADWKARNEIVETDDVDEAEAPDNGDSDADTLSEGFREAAE